MTAPDSLQFPSVPDGAVWTTVAEAKRCGWQVQFADDGAWNDAALCPSSFDDRYVLAHPKPLPPLPREWAEEVIAALDPNGMGGPMVGPRVTDAARRRLFDAATAALASQDGAS